MTPASNLKLVTTSTALDTLGPERTFPTRLALAGDDLYLIGSGDPGLGDSVIAGWAKLKPLDHFAPFAKALRDRGLTHLKGNLYYDDRAFDDQWPHPPWSKSFREFWYAAPVSGLNFNDNCIDVTVHPPAPGEPVTFDVLPPTAGIKIVNHCLTGDKQTPAIKRGSDPNEYILTGTCATPAGLASKPVENPGYFTADALRTYLASQGITIDGKILPTDGADGTLKKRLTEIKGQVQAKTGSIGRVRALSGYATTPDGRTFAFSLLCNDIDGDEDTAVKRMDDALRALLK